MGKRAKVGGKVAKRGGKPSRPPTRQTRRSGATKKQAAVGVRRQELDALRQENARLSREIAEAQQQLTESLQQQTATADVLKVISRSTFDLQSVLDTLLESACHLCEAEIGTIRHRDGAGYRLAATYGCPPEWRDHFAGYSTKADRGSVFGRTIVEGRTVHLPDVLADPEFVHARSEAQRLMGFRAALGVPLVRDHQVFGVINLFRSTPLSFTQKQIELVETFADQAVIAIENARLFEEVEARSVELTESLQQQIATADVLKVISRSTFDLKPVLETLVESAMRLCQAEHSFIFLREGDVYRLAVSYGYSNEYAELIRERAITPGRNTLVARTVLESRIIHIPDVLEDPEYTWREAQIQGGFRSMLGVPLLRQGEPIGVISIVRNVVAPFTDKQIELVSTFADQAVIAIENVRLFEEVQARTVELTESLQQRTATAEVLKVISRSVFELQPVLDTLVESATRLCNAFDAVITLREGDDLAIVAHHGPIPIDFKKWPISRAWTAGRAYIDRRPIHVHDYLAEGDEYPDGRSMAERMGQRTMLSVPLLRENEAIGALTIRRSQVEPFSARQIELAETFADQAVIAIENVRLFEEVQARTVELTEALEQQTATAEVLGIISSSPSDLEPVFQAMLRNAMRICQAEFGSLFEYADGTFRALSLSGVPDAFAAFIRQSRVWGTETGLGQVVQTKKTVHVADATRGRAYEDNDPGRAAAVKTGAVRAIVVVPMLRDDELIGAFSIWRAEPRPFTDKQIELVTSFAHQAVIAIENVRLLRELRESLQQQTATADVLKVISRSTFDLQAVLDTLVESATRLCGADHSWIFQREGDFFHWAAGFGHATEEHARIRDYFKGRDVPADRGSITGRCAAEGRVVHVHDVLADSDYTWSGAQRVGGYRAGLGVPLLRDGKVVGVIFLAKTLPEPFTEKQIELATTFADQAVIAIENVRLFDEVQARTVELTESLQQQTATADVLKVISRSAFDLKSVLQTLVESAARLCEADKATITRQVDGIFYRGEAYGFSDEFMAYVRGVPVEPTRETGTGRALLEGRVIHIPDVETDPDYRFAEAQRLGDFRTMLAVPMLREGIAIGVIVLTRSEVRPFTDKQIELASTFADQAAIAIENVRLFESVEARTQELSKSLEELRTAQDRLVQTEKLASLGQLTAGIAHEIKNPLNFVNNFAALSGELLDELGGALGKTALDEGIRGEIAEVTDMLRGNLERVVQHGKRADSIVKNMLLHSRQSSGEHRPTDVNAIVEESLNLAYHGARAERQGFNITLQKALDPEAGEVDLFPQEITRVLLNLISNGFYAATKRRALEAGGSFEPTLSAATRNLGDRVEIRIRDNGTGIPPDVKEKMFNPFFTTKPAGEGTGLGLSLSHDIVVKQHAGTIEVETEVGRFTEFRIVLPRTAATMAKAGER